MRWRKAAILGVGLLGGSLGLALRRRGLVGEVSGFVRREATAADAVRCGAVDTAATRLEAVVSGADLVVLCTPVARMGPLALELAPHLMAGMTVTDVGSVKAGVLAAVNGPVRRAGGVFIGSHPLAGSERTGVGAARADLFAGAVCVVTPAPDDDASAVARVTGLWGAVGARVLEMSAEDHDRLVSRSSHLPHVVAAALANYILSGQHPAAQSLLCASGFRDTTRIASGSPEMWRDIALANRDALLAAMHDLAAQLGDFEKALRAGDHDAVLDYFASAKRRRDGWCGNGGPAVSE